MEKGGWMIRGTFDEFSVLEVIRLILTTKKTGVLYVFGREGRGSISFEDGEICAADTTLANEPLGRRLVRRGDLPEAELGPALERLEGNNVRLGESLVAAGVVRRDAVRSALEEQVHDGVLDVLRLRPNEFRWEHEDPAPVAAPGTEQMLAAVTERLTQLERVSKRYAGDVWVTLSPVVDRAPSEIRLAADEWRVVALLGTRRSLRDVLRYSPGGDTRALLALDRLVEEGLVEVVTDPGARDSRAMVKGPPAVDGRGGTPIGARLGEVISLDRDESAWGTPEQMDRSEGQL
jgi:hypothetical protein